MPAEVNDRGLERAQQGDQILGSRRPPGHELAAITQAAAFEPSLDLSYLFVDRDPVGFDGVGGQKQDRPLADVVVPYPHRAGIITERPPGEAARAGAAAPDHGNLAWAQPLAAA